MKRFILHSYLKPEKVEEYVKLHSEPWPELVQLMTECHLHNYSISIRGMELYTYYEYSGEGIMRQICRRWLKQLCCSGGGSIPSLAFCIMNKVCIMMSCRRYFIWHEKGLVRS